MLLPGRGCAQAATPSFLLGWRVGKENDIEKPHCNTHAYWLIEKRLQRQILIDQEKNKTMMYLKRTLTITIFLLLAIAIAACGSSTSSGSNSTSSTPTTAAATPTSSNAIVKTSTVTINGKSETVLTDAQ